MPSAKQTKAMRESKSKSSEVNFWEKLNLTDSYASLLLGIVAVVILSFLVVAFIRSQKSSQLVKTDSKTKKESLLESQKRDKNENSSTLGDIKPQTTYIVKEGDTLWSISERAYKSGYNWVDIAVANKLQDPSIIHSDNKLIIPNVTPKTPTVETTSNQINKTVIVQGSVSSSISSTSYEVIKGDDLWDIAVRAYGDGYKWIDIAKTNNLANPDIIEAGQVLKLPRT